MVSVSVSEYKLSLLPRNTLIAPVFTKQDQKTLLAVTNTAAIQDYNLSDRVGNITAIGLSR